MGDYHFVYKDLEGSSTEWDDLQRKFGNLPPKPAPFKPPAWTPAPDDDGRGAKSKEWLENKTEDELDELEDDPDLDDARFLEEYRKKRLAELKGKASKPRFGSVLPIVGADFVREVSQAPPEVWVVVHLYKDGFPECEILGQCLDEMAAKYSSTKFVKIISTDCIPNYPDRNLPTVLVYNSSNVKATYVGLHHFGGRHCTPESVAFTFCQTDPAVLGGGSDESINEAVMDKVRKGFIEKVVAEREQDRGDSSDDD
uniref:Phosducin domain-containing protein n=1 Tax=Araucaria cunninghamii TaxID=56994 RepID=A0A0D6QUG6_ARACU